MRVTLDGPDGWAHGWITNGHNAPLRVRRQQGGGGPQVLAALIKDERVGPCRVKDGLKINSQNLLPVFRRRHFCQAVVKDFYAEQCFITCIQVLHCVAAQQRP